MVYVHPEQTGSQGAFTLPAAPGVWIGAPRRVDLELGEAFLLRLRERGTHPHCFVLAAQISILFFQS